MSKRPGNEFGQRWALWKPFDIRGKDGDLYLHRRRIVQTPAFGVYVHRIYREDFDRHPHDHPWQFVSVILRGGYWERVHEAAPLADGRILMDRVNLTGRLVYRRRGSVHLHRYSRAHRITKVKPGTISLVVVGRRRGGWGFWTAEGFRPWRDYLAEQGHPQAGSVAKP